MHGVNTNKQATDMKTAEQLLYPVAMGLLAIYLTVVGVWDLRTRKVPNFLTLPAMGLVLVWRAVRIVLAVRHGQPVSPELTFIWYWLGAWLLWSLGAMGGGDAKLLMVLFGIFPTGRFLALLLVVSGSIMALLLMWRYWQQKRLGMFFKNLWVRARMGRFFPNRRQVELEGEPTAFLFSLAGMVMILIASL